MSNLISKIKSANAYVYRKAFVKRRLVGTGLYEDDWQEITEDVKTWGTYKASLDEARPFSFRFDNAKIVVQNEQGKYNPEDDEASLWYGYVNQQRTLLKIEAGFVSHSMTSMGFYRQTYFPQDGGGDGWDTAIWDDDDYAWDGTNIPQSMFIGLISGDILLTDKNEVNFNIKPLYSVFQDYPAMNLTGFTSTGMTASQFITLLRDQTDGSGHFVFRPFFGNTITYWDISTTSNVLGALNTSTSDQVFNSTVWEVIETLAAAENFVPYVARDGTFKFVSRAANTTTTTFDFYGAGYFNSQFGQTIKSVNSYGRKISKYYSTVDLKWGTAETTTSHEIVQGPFVVSGSNSPWVLGQRVLSLENVFIQTSTVANALATSIYNDVSSLRNEIDFSTTFIPHLDLLDRISVYYDPSGVDRRSLWDQGDWADDLAVTPTDLIWDNSKGDAIKINGQEFKFISIAIDLDKFENRFIAKEV